MLCLLATSLFLARLPGAATKLESQPAVHPTITRDIAPILYWDCASCHHASDPGAHAASGQFALVSYEEVKQRAGEILSVTASRRMPPWLPEVGLRRSRNRRTP
ncbi:MAG TPA: hypothetical protein VKH45_08345 [Candidatus Acidoferrum sp.]|nr:hypothetical protein [Candidatus Acidoferrum sp.]